MFTDNTHFVFDIELPATDPNKGQGEQLKNFIAYKEPEVLTDVLGYAMYQDLLTHVDDTSGVWYDFINGNEFTDKNGNLSMWNGFKSVMSNPIAYIIYCAWLELKNSTMTNTGNVQAAHENATAISPRRQIVTAWNKAVGLFIIMDDYIIQNQADFTNYVGISYAPFITNPTSLSAIKNNQYFKKLNMLDL